MLKFQDDYTTLVATFEDFISLAYTVIDEICNKYCRRSAGITIVR